MKKVLNHLVARFLVVWISLYFAFPLYSQSEDDSEQLLFQDEQGEEKSAAIDSVFNDLILSPTLQENSTTAVPVSNDNYGDGGTNNDKKSAVQNAVLEGIQLGSEPGESADEKIVTCYFIFRDKPTSYFFEAKKKEKEIVFEFNDVEIGTSPISSAQESPIQGFRFHSEKIDANKEVVGLNPEWHDILKVTFFVDAIPEITVKDEYSVISFAFKWSSNPEKAKEYVQRDRVNRPLIYSLIGGGIAIPAVVALVLIINPDEKPKPPQPLSIDDLPVHP